MQRTPGFNLRHALADSPPRGPARWRVGRTPSFNLRHALAGIAALAIVLALFRPLYDRFQADLQRQAQIQRGTSIIRAFGPLRPNEVSPATWSVAVQELQQIWTYSNQESSLSLAEREDVLDQMQSMLERGNAGAHEGDLLAILDSIALARAVADLSGKREWRPFIPSVAMRRYYMPFDVIFRHEVDELWLRRLQSSGGRSSPRIIQFALRFLEKPSDDPVADLSAGLAHPDWRVRTMVCRGLTSLVRTGRSEEALPILVLALKDRDPLVRELAAQGLHWGSPAGAAAVPALADVSQRDVSVTVRQIALQTISMNGQNAGELGTSALIAALRDPEPRVRTAAVNGIGLFRNKSKTAIAAVVEILATDPDDLVRNRAAVALAASDDVALTVPALTKAMNDYNSLVRDEAIKSLTELGRLAIPALEAIRQAPNVKSETRLCAERALGKIREQGTNKGPSPFRGVR